MQCPNCNKEAITKRKFLSKVTPKGIKCTNCGVDLKLNKLLVITYYFSLIFGIIAGVIAIILSEKYKFNFIEGLVTFVIIALIVAIPMEHFAWKKGELIKK